MADRDTANGPPKHLTATASVDYRVFINGFPKAGTHLAEQYVRPICPPMRAEKPWAGSFGGNSWTEEWVEDYRLFRTIGWLNDGAYAKGHMGYRRDIEMFLWGIGATVLFVLRDLRDVAVSQANHILRGGEHPEPEPFQEIVKREGFQAGLRMCIEGWQGKVLSPDGKPHYYSGVIARWRHYAPWLWVPWVLSLKFEHLINGREAVAEAIVRACVGRAAIHRGHVARISKDVMAESIARMVQASYQTDQSPTFYKGTSRQWEPYFDDDLRALWKQYDPPFRHEKDPKDKPPMSWLVRLGYEEDEAW